MVTGLVPWVIGTVISKSCRKGKRQKSQRETRCKKHREGYREEWVCTFCVFVQAHTQMDAAALITNVDYDI